MRWGRLLPLPPSIPPNPLICNLNLVTLLPIFWFTLANHHNKVGSRASPAPWPSGVTPVLFRSWRQEYHFFLDLWLCHLEVLFWNTSSWFSLFLVKVKQVSWAAGHASRRFSILMTTGGWNQNKRKASFVGSQMDVGPWVKPKVVPANSYMPYNMPYDDMPYNMPYDNMQ